MGPSLSESGVVFQEFLDPPIPLQLWLVYREDPPSLLVHGFARACRESRAAMRSGQLTRDSNVGMGDEGDGEASSA
jgi:hypothetical protein